eukprot:g4358.t1
MEDISAAALTIKELGDESGFKIALCDDISSRDPLVDAEGTVLNADVFGWVADGQRWWENRCLALDSPIVRACRYEGEPFWCNKEGFYGHGENPYIEEIKLDTYFAEQASSQSAILIPIHLPFAQISANSLHPLDEAKEDLAEEYEYYADFFAIVLRRFIAIVFDAAGPSIIVSRDSEGILTADSNWKFALDTYGESYHFSTLHKSTIAKTNYNDKNVFEPFGRHHRVSFPKLDLKDLLDKPESEWPDFEYGGVHFLFPNTVIFFGAVAPGMYFTQKTQAAVAYPDETIFRLETLDIDPPRADEVLVEIKGVGICHTDLTFRSGNIPYPFPAVFGHEGSGLVQAVGANVTKVKAGDHVLITFRSCGDCDLCNAGDPAYCRSMPQLNITGSREDGSTSLNNANGSVGSNFFGQSSFAAHAITYERNLVKVDADLPIELLGPLGCSIQTGAGSVMKSLSVRAGSSILIAGAGPVGLSAVMGAAIQKCASIIVLEPLESRRQLAREFGATHCIDPTAIDDVTAEIMNITPLGVDNALDTTARDDVLQTCFQCLGAKAILGLVGVGDTETKLPGSVQGLLWGGKGIKAIVEGDSNPDEFLPELIDHYRAGRLPIDRMITTYKLSEINQAIEEQKSGVCTKAVLIPESSPPQ